MDTVEIKGIYGEFRIEANGPGIQIRTDYDGPVEINGVPYRIRADFKLNERYEWDWQSGRPYDSLFMSRTDRVLRDDASPSARRKVIDRLLLAVKVWADKNEEAIIAGREKYKQEKLDTIGREMQKREDEIAELRKRAMLIAAGDLLISPYIHDPR